MHQGFPFYESYSLILCPNKPLFSLVGPAAEKCLSGSMEIAEAGGNQMIQSPLIHKVLPWDFSCPRNWPPVVNEFNIIMDNEGLAIILSEGFLPDSL